MVPLNFLFGPVLWAATAAAAPVIIHLIMRTKPRKITFPALRFVKKTHQANISKLRLKHLILLLMRMAAIVLIAVLVARAEIPNQIKATAVSAPVAAVFVLDNSGSMTYKPDQRTLLSAAKQMAQQIIDTLPPGSKIAVLSTADPSAGGTLLSDSKLAAQQVADLPDSFSSQSAAAALTRAVTLASGTRLSRKEVYLLSDMTIPAFRAMTPLAAPPGVQFILINVGKGKDANLGLGDLKLESRSVPAGAEVTIEAPLFSSRLGGEVNLRVELENRPVVQKAVSLPADASTIVSLAVQPAHEGVLHGRVMLEQSDPLEMDNVRYFTLRVGRPVKVLVVRDGAAVGRGEETHTLMNLAISAGASWVQTQTVTPDQLDEAVLDKARVVILANVASVNDSHWQKLGKFVRSGGRLWVVAGSMMSAAVGSYNSPAAQALMPVSFKSLEEFPDPLMWKPRGAGQEMLQPFAGENNPPLAQIRCSRRFGVQSVAADAHVVVEFTDAETTPAIVTRPIGEGEVLLWNFSPVRGFSNLHAMEQFPILAQRTVRIYAGETTASTMQTWGKTVTLPLPKTFASGMVTVLKPGEQREEALVADMKNRTVTVRADKPGHWTVKFAQAGESLVDGFSVNAEAVESDLKQMEQRKIETLFPPDRVFFAADAAEVIRRQQTTYEPLDLTTPILLALLFLLTVETYFANRFYKQSPVATETTAA